MGMVYRLALPVLLWSASLMLGQPIFAYSRKALQAPVQPADRQLLFRLGGGGGRVVELTVEDAQTVVELVVANDPHVVTDGTEGLDGRIVLLWLIKCVVIS